MSKTFKYQQQDSLQTLQEQFMGGEDKLGNHLQNMAETGGDIALKRFSSEMLPLER
ncbi:MAG: hypothetical protein ACFB2X_03895 [Rivularia sp. (in: cyanobacteria)]